MNSFAAALEEGGGDLAIFTNKDIGSQKMSGARYKLQVVFVLQRTYVDY